MIKECVTSCVASALCSLAMIGYFGQRTVEADRIVLTGPAGAVLAELGQDNGRPFLRLFDETGTRACELSSGGEGGKLLLYGEAHGAALLTGSDAGLVVFSKEDKRSARLSFSDRSIGYYLTDAGGGLRSVHELSVDDEGLGAAQFSLGWHNEQWREMQLCPSVFDIRVDEDGIGELTLQDASKNVLIDCVVEGSGRSNVVPSMELLAQLRRLIDAK